MRIKIPKGAKLRARQGLKTDAGISKKKANKLNINSGRERAKQLIQNKYIQNPKDIKSMISFYNRFKNKKSKKTENALKLWGGRSFLRSIKSRYKRK